jgi:hypothetical protein
MPRIIDDDDENEGEDSPASLRDFIVPDDDKDGPAPSVVTPRPLEDVIGFIEDKLTGSKLRMGGGLLEAAEESYKKLAHDCLVLAYQAEADWKPGFRKLLRKSIGARIKADANKDSVRDEDVCAACGRDEERSNMRLDLFGSYELRNFCQPADLEQKWADFSKESTTPTDYGSFYLGNECLRKFQTSFLLRTHMSDLVGAAARRIKDRTPTGGLSAFGRGWGDNGFHISDDGGIAHYFRNRRERLELATANRRHWPPILAANRELFGKIDLMRTRAGWTPKFLYEFGLKVIEEGNKEGADDDDPGLRDDAKNDCEEGEEEEEESGAAGPSQPWAERRAEARAAARAATRAQTQAQGEGPPSTRTRGRQRGGKPPQKPVSPIGKRRLPKKRARGVIESSDDDTAQEFLLDDEEADDAVDESPPAQAVPLADLSSDGAGLSRKKAIADLHHLAGKLTEVGMQQEARIAATAAFVASEMLDELGARGTR